MANTALTVTSLNFDEIRQGLRAYISSKPEFEDYDFADSAIGTLLDLLAYNTYYNAFYINMAANESFLDTAQFYDNVVSRAKMLGYLPTSARGATANVHIRFTTATATPLNPTLTIPKDTKFTTSINGTSYMFVTPKSYTVAANSTNMFETDIELVEGVPLTHRFAFTTANTSFVLPNQLVDTRSVSVTVTTNGSTQAYVLANDTLTVNSSSKVFYMEAERDRKYKISFGDNILGMQPAYNSLVSVSYRVCNATKGNGAGSFAAVGSVAGQSNFVLTVNERATGGADQETINSIKFNAPKAYETQNRAVTSDDYQRIILRDNSDLQAVQVWGGEDNDPPIYGKVFACAKPYQGTLISSARKTQIQTEMKKYGIRSLEFTDPTFLYIIPTVSIIYDEKLTAKTPSEIAASVASRIISYESSTFNRFDSKFWLSRFLSYLDASDVSIVGSRATIDLQKRFRPSTSVRNNYTFRFNTPLEYLGDQSAFASSGVASSRHPGFGWLTSSAFTYNGFTSYLEDNGFGTIRTYYVDLNAASFGRVYTDYATGTVDYNEGTVFLKEFLPTAYAGSEMRINVKPRTQNIVPVRNQLLLFTDATVTVSEVNGRTPGASLTTIATSGASTSLNETALFPTMTY